MKVKVISLPYIFQVLYVLCFTRSRYQVSVYRTNGPLVLLIGCKNYAAVTTSDQIYFTILDVKKQQFRSMYRGFEPVYDEEMGDVQVWNELCHEKTCLGFPIRSDTNWTVEPQKMVRALKFRIKDVGGLYCLCSKNKGTDQMCCYHAADLHLCFRICKELVFS